MVAELPQMYKTEVSIMNNQNNNQNKNQNQNSNQSNNQSQNNR